MAYLAGKPVLILKEGASRSRGREARRSNIAAARIIAEVLRTTLGPRGMDKMLIDSLGDITITNDGASILEEIDVQHPAAKMVIEVAKTQDKEVGDGTTTAVVLVGELLYKADELLRQNIHPSIIITGYRKAMERAMEVLDKLGMDIDVEDREMLKKVAVTSMRSKIAGMARDHLAEIAIDAVKQIVEERDGETIADIDNIQIVKKEGESLEDSELVKGIIIDKEVVHPGMPKRVENAKIALLDCPLEVEKTEIDAEIRISSPEAIKAFLDQETELLRSMVEKIKETGANVVFCQKGIDDMAQHFLAKNGILAVRRIKKSDLEKLARATGGRIVSSLDDLKPSDLGTCELVEERKIADEKMVFVEGCKDPRSVAVFLRAGLERMIDEAERTMRDALSVISDVMELSKIVPGGGAIETELAKDLRDYAKKVGGREQLAIEAFADALEVIPKTLAENAGLDPLDILVSLRAAHEKADGFAMGVNVFEGGITNMLEKGVIEPLAVKKQAIKSAVEAASMILRIDDVIAAKPPSGEEEGAGGPSEGGKEEEEE
ncbi:TCP-1/cpn60 chaperonin family protein [Candidatus Bathyarchaeota archaeon]|nr:TCP-1/cpn60 chaperonin family protein [Candidatus Bathyarchaeota archaeon]